MVSEYSEALKNLAIKLYEINAFKFGEFKMKSGLMSPVYFDLRVIISYPEVMADLNEILVDFIKQKQIVTKHVCGVPYTALPIATLLSVHQKIPMLIRRKETKSYGTKKLIEGNFQDSDVCLIVEDVVTSGSSVLETVKDLRGEKLNVTDAIVVVNREQGGAESIARTGIKLHSIFTLSNLLSILKNAGKIKEDIVRSVSSYIAANQTGGCVAGPSDPSKILDRTKMTYLERGNHTQCQVAKKLFHLMEAKETNLCVAVDLTTAAEILNVAEAVGPYICVLKTHIDIVDDFSKNFIHSLTALASKHNFLIMEDRKFADIGNTVSLQYSKGLYNISQWADFVTVHSLPGASILKGLKQFLTDVESRGVFVLAEMSSTDNLINAQYTEQTLQVATHDLHTNFVAGIVCQNKSVFSEPGLIQLTPGVQLTNGSDNLGQQYNSPEVVIGEKGADIAVVGRGIIKASNIGGTAKLYRDRLWAAYCDRLEAAE